MDSRTGDQTAQKTMQGTIALLLSLADLADQAAGRAWCLRCYILWVMRFAEAVAWDYIAESLDGFAPPVRRMADFLPAGSRARARNLAQTFRRAARLLQAQERRFAKLTLRSPAGDWLADAEARRAWRFCLDLQTAWTNRPDRDAGFNTGAPTILAAPPPVYDSS